MKIINLVRSEFIKNYSLKKIFIISFILLISIILIVEGYYLLNFYNNRSIEGTKSTYNLYFHRYNEVLKKENRTFSEEIDLKYYKDAYQIFDILVKNNVKYGDWQTEITHLNYLNLKKENYIMDFLNNSNNSNEVVEICNKKEEYRDYNENSLCHYYNVFSKNELLKEYVLNNEKINSIKSILEENKYYLYFKYKVDNNIINNKDKTLIDIIIDNKLTYNDYRVINYNQIGYMDMFINHEFITEDEFIHGKDGAYYEYSFTFPNYNRYKKYYEKLKEEATKDKKIIEYSSINNIKHDISFNKDIKWQLEDNLYPTTKNFVNLIFHLSVVVLIIVSITSSGIVSSEHNNGTIKNIITAPVKRWKIILSKFIYLILHTYILWFICLFILSIYCGIRFGFNDLLSPKLIYSHDKVIEVNYYLYLLKNMFLASIPIISFLSILLFISAITLSTAVTTGISILLSIISIVLFIIGASLKLKSIIYIPFLYFDSGFLFLNSKYYNLILEQTDISLNKGIITSLITIVILYSITNVIYNKKDIKS